MSSYIQFKYHSIVALSARIMFMYNGVDLRARRSSKEEMALLFNAAVFAFMFFFAAGLLWMKQSW